MCSFSLDLIAAAWVEFIVHVEASRAEVNCPGEIDDISQIIGPC
jgi:hypothetical protein